MMGFASLYPSYGACSEKDRGTNRIGCSRGMEATFGNRAQCRTAAKVSQENDNESKSLRIISAVDC
jgi:hypothetical protein